MAAMARISAALFVLCSILPLLASAKPVNKPVKPAEEPLVEGMMMGKDGENVLGLGSLSGGSDHPYGKDDRAVEMEFANKKTVAPKPKAPGQANGGLRLNFYERSCPRAEQIVQEVFAKANLNDAGLAAAILRLHTHDCFVQGCDASILLDKNPTGGPIEKTAAPNGAFIRGTEIIDEIKDRLERECPGIVSCADILTYAARDALAISGVPRYEVPGGRRDGLSTIEKEVLLNIPVPENSMDRIIKLFANKGMDEEDVVVLIGAHSIGISHCGNFAYRVNNKTKEKEMDPRITALVRFSCGNPMNSLPFDTVTQFKMDSAYYKGLLEKRGLLESDQFMVKHPKTRGYVKKFANDQNGWLKKFAAAMVKMSKLDVLTGNEGQIRKKCRFVN